MLLVGYCHSIRSERRLYDEAKANLVYRWFCRLGLEDKVPHHSTFSVNRLGRFRDSDLLRKVFEEVVCSCMKAGLVGGEGFAVDASVIEADASRFQRVEGSAVAWTGAGISGGPGRRARTEQSRASARSAVACGPGGLDHARAARGDVRLPLNYLIDLANAVIVDVEAPPTQSPKRWMPPRR